MKSTGLKIFLNWLVCILLLSCNTNLQGQEQDSSYFWQRYVEGRNRCEASDFYNARVILEQTLSEVKENNYKDYKLEAKILTDIAWAYAGLRDNVTENIYIEAALRIFVENLTLESEEYATALHDMALTQGDRGNFEYAKELIDSSTVIFRKHLPDLYPSGKAANLLALGWLYRAWGKYDKAVAALKDAAQYVVLEGGDTYTNIGTVNHILGYTLMYNGQSTDALPLLLAGKKYREENLGITHPKYHQSHQKIAECYSYLGRYENAQLHLDTIIASLHTKAENESGHEMQLDSIKSWYTLLQTYVTKGNIYLRKYKIYNEVEDLEMNLKWFKNAIDAVQKILLYYPSKEGRFQMLKSYAFLFDNCVNQALLLYDYDQNPKYLKLAFQVSELSRGFTFLESLHKAQATANYEVPKELLEEESALIIKMQKFELGNEQDIEKSQNWIRLNLELQRIQQKIKKDFPSYFDLQSNLVVPTIEDIQNQIADSTAIVEYFEGSQKLFQFIITRDTAMVYSLSIPKDYHQTLNQLINHISNNPILNNESFKSFKVDARNVYDWIISPLDSIIRTKKSLVFIPHKMLNYLPFETLLQYDSTTSNNKFLIENHAISYDYSCASLLAKRENYSQPIYPYHGIAPGIRKENLTDESFNEVKDANKVLGGKYFLKHKANRQIFFEGLQKANILHVAAHSVLDTSDLSKFAIVLNDIKNKKNRDSVLIENIYLSKINSNLVILSGCQTADGVLKDGIGLLSLTNAFKYAGAASLTCSLWETENKVSTKIITNYIKNIQKGQFKNEALRAAKMDFLQSADPLLRHPFFWSTFVNVGNQAPISLTKKSLSTNRYTYFTILAFFIFSIGILIAATRKLKF